MVNVLSPWWLLKVDEIVVLAPSKIEAGRRSLKRVIVCV